MFLTECLWPMERGQAKVAPFSVSNGSVENTHVDNCRATFPQGAFSSVISLPHQFDPVILDRVPTTFSNMRNCSGFVRWP